MPSRTRLFRVFVSSTFEDFKAEREALQEVFLRLNELCRSFGCAFQAVDLRWGVSEEAARKQLTMGICREEIERCRETSPNLFFLGLIGERYGWCPLPTEIPASLFERILATRPSTVLSSAYRKDENARPPVYCLLPQEEKVGLKKWREVEIEIHTELVMASHELAFSEEDRIMCCGSATESELWHGTLAATGRGAFCFLRTIVGSPPGLFRDDGPAGENLKTLRENLRQKLPDDRLIEYPALMAGQGIREKDIAWLCSEVEKCLGQAIRDKLSGPEEREWDLEARFARDVKAHEEYGRQRTRGFVGQKEPIKVLQAYLMGPSSEPFAVVGPSGAGKSSLLAKVVEEIRPKFADNVVVQRFIGATPESSDPAELLKGLCWAIFSGYADRIEATDGAAALRKRQGELSSPATYERLVGLFQEHLALASPERPLLVMVDALDQLDFGREVRAYPWVPPRLPPWAKLVVSGLPETLPALEKTVPQTNIFNLGELGLADAKRLVQLLLKGAGVGAPRRLQPEQWEKVLSTLRTCSLPLFIKILFERLRLLRSYEPVGDLKSGTYGIISGLLGDLSDGMRHGSALVFRALGFLAAARSGITDAEMRVLLSRDAEVREEFSRRHPDSPTIQEKDLLPQIIWTRLYFDLRPYLSLRKADGTEVLSFFHRQFGEVVREWALAGAAKKERHQALAAFFGEAPLYLDLEGQRVTDGRKLGELPFQQTNAGLWDEAVETLTNFTFLEPKIRTMGPTPVLQDFFRILALHPGARPVLLPSDQAVLTTLERAIRLSAQALIGDPSQLASQILGRLRSPASPRLQRLLTDAARMPGPWLRPIVPRLSDPESGLSRTLVIHQHVVRCACVLADETTVVSGSEIVSRPGDSALKVWDITTGMEVGVLPGVRGGVFALCTAGEFVVAGMEDGTLGMWEPSGGGMVCELQAGEKTVSAVASLPETDEILSGGYDGKIWLLNHRTRVSRVVGEHTEGINGLAISLEAGVVVSVSHDQTVKVWNLTDFSLRHELHGHTGSVDAVSISEGGDVAATASADGTVILWDIKQGSMLSQLRAEGIPLRSVAFISSGGRPFVAAGEEGGGLSIWDAKTAALQQTLRAHTDHVYDLTWVRRHGLLVSAGKDTALKIWDTDILVEKNLDRTASVGRMPTFELDSDGQRVMAVLREDNGRWRPPPWPVVDLTTGEILPGGFSNGFPGKRFVIRRRSTGDDPAGLLEAVDHELDPDVFDAMAKSLDWCMLKGRSGTRLTAPTRWNGPPNTLAERSLLYARIIGKGEVRLVDLKNFMEITWKPHEDWVTALAASPDGQILATASTDYTIRLWDVSARASALPRLRATLFDHSREVNCIAFAREKPFLVSGSDDWSALLWDLAGETPRRIARFDAEGPLVACELSPDGSNLAVADESGIVHVLRLVS